MTPFIIISVIILLALGYLAFRLFNNRANNARATKANLSSELKQLLQQHVSYYDRLLDDEKLRLKG